jgi:integrase
MSDPIKKLTLTDGSTRYRFVIDVGRNTTGKRKQVTKTYDTRREAKSEYAKIRHESDRGTYVSRSGMTVDTYLTEWLASATRDVEKATAANYRDAMRPVRERLGDRPIQRLTEADVEGLVDWMLTSGRKRGGTPGTGLSVRSARLTLGRFKAALNDALRRGLVVRNVAQFVTIKREDVRRDTEAKPARTPWTEAEVKTFLAGITEARLFSIMLLSLMGLRPAETCGLRWSDIDLTAGTIAAGDNTRTLVDGVVEEKPAKSERGKRALPLPVTVITALKAFKARQATERLAAGEAYTTTGYMLVDELGLPVKTDWLRRQTYKLMDETGVRKVRPYDARHACLTILAAGGVPDVIVSAWAGHADLSFTKRTYVHPDPSHLQAAADRLDKMIG